MAVAAVIVIATGLAVVVVARRDDGAARVISEPAAQRVFSEPTGTVLLLSDGIDGVTAIDLDSRIGGRTVIPGERAGDQPFRITVTGNHVVVGWGEIYAQPLRGGPSTKIDDATIYVPAAEAGGVWTITWDGERIGVGSAVVRRVTVDGQITFTSRSLDAATDFPLLGVPGGLAVSTADGVAVWDAATGQIGRFRVSGPATSVASNGRSLAWCEVSCAKVHVVPLPRTGPPTAPHAALSQEIALSNDGRRLAFLRPVTGDGSALVIRDLRSGEESTVATGLSRYGSITWSSDSTQLFSSEYSKGQSAMRLGRYSVTSGTWEETRVSVGGAIRGLVAIPSADASTFFSATVGEPGACPPAGFSYPSGRHGVCSFHF